MQKSKCWAVENSYSMLLEKVLPEDEACRMDNFLILSGSLSPSIRASMSADGETTKAVLDSVFKSPSKIDEVFKWTVRVAETDEAGSNSRCEHMMIKQHPQRAHLGMVCLAHKLHAVAAKTWCLFPSCISGVVHSSLALSMAGSMSKIKDGLDWLLRSYEVRPLFKIPLEDAQFRDNMVAAFMPSETKPRQRAVCMAVVRWFNGRWQQADKMTHLRAQSAARMQHLLGPRPNSPRCVPTHLQQNRMLWASHKFGRKKFSPSWSFWIRAVVCIDHGGYVDVLERGNPAVGMRLPKVRLDSFAWGEQLCRRRV